MCSHKTKIRLRLLEANLSALGGRVDELTRDKTAKQEDPDQTLQENFLGNVNHRIDELNNGLLYKVTDTPWFISSVSIKGDINIMGVRGSTPCSIFRSSRSLQIIEQVVFEMSADIKKAVGWNA